MRSQKLQPVVRVGSGGLNAGLLAALDEALSKHGLVKVKFDHLKDQKKILVPELAEKSGSRIVLFVGNTVTLFRAGSKPEPTRAVWSGSPHSKVPRSTS